MIGKEYVGKSLLINKIIGKDCPLMSKPTESSLQNYITQYINTILLVNGEKYHCTFIEMLSHSVRAVQRRLLENLNLIIYVCRYDCFTYEDQEDFQDCIRFFKSARHSVSALVITGCEYLNDEERAQVVENFKSDISTKDIAANMDGRIYTVGLCSPTDYPNPSKCVAQKDVSKLRLLIERAYYEEQRMNERFLQHMRYLNLKFFVHNL